MLGRLGVVGAGVLPALILKLMAKRKKLNVAEEEFGKSQDIVTM